MTLIKAILATALSTTCLVMTSTANATTYNVAGTYMNGTTFLGSFDIDFSGAANSQFTNIDIGASNGLTYYRTAGSGYSPPYVGAGDFYYGFADAPQSTSVLYLFFQASHNEANITAIANQALDPRSTLRYQDTNFGLVSGRISAEVSAVPEVPTWGMMIGGFGMIGAAMRTRGRSTKVTFA